MQNNTPVQGPASYAWVIVAACTAMIFITYGLQYSYSVFFKPLAEHFDWDRATVSFVYSASLVIRGAVSIGAGWLADRYGARKVMIVCGFLMGLGFLLSSRVTELWQFFLTYAVIEAIGFSGTFGVGTSMISRWFTKNRGLALGIMASGSGLGTLLIVPGAERLIDAAGWQQAFVVCGIAAGTLMIAAAFLLREPASRLIKTPESTGGVAAKQEGMSFSAALIDPRMLLMAMAFMFFFFGAQMVMVHLVNYATDTGIDPLIAATFIGVIGGASIGARLAIGAGSDKIGIFNGLYITGSLLVLSFILLLFTRTVWSFYLFAVLFSIPYGGEIPQIPLIIGRYFGTRSMATLVGVNVFIITIGGAMGSWAAGKIFDVTGSYDWAFIAGAVAALCSLGMVLLLKRQDRHPAVK
jgi:MFS family permease